jgi:hypothetical protein
MTAAARALEIAPGFFLAATRSNDGGREVASGVVEPRHTVHRRRRERGVAARVAVPDAASAVRRSGAEAPAVRPVNPSLLLGERLGADKGESEDHCCGLNLLSSACGWVHHRDIGVRAAETRQLGRVLIKRKLTVIPTTASLAVVRI